MAHFVKCVVCNEQFDRDKEDYFRVNQLRYAHQKCAKEANLDSHEVTQEKKQIIQSIHNMMRELLKENYSQSKITRQINQMLKNGRTEVGILNALKYWYEVKKSDPSKANGGIAIVDYIYGDAQNYWCDKKNAESRNKNVDIKEVTKHYYVKPTKLKKPRKLTWFNLD